MDIYIPWPRRVVDSKYAFVKYREKRELRKAIHMGHGRIIYGRQIRVFEVDKLKNKEGTKVKEEDKTREDEGADV